MERMKLGPTHNEIYMILRVYNLGRPDMGLRILMDPATMKQNGELSFEPETYTVLQDPTARQSG